MKQREKTISRRRGTLFAETAFQTFLDQNEIPRSKS